MRVPMNSTAARSASVLLLAGALLCFAPPALADDEEIDPTLLGPYVGVGFGGAFENFGGHIQADDSIASNFVLGYRGSEFISIEFAFDFMESFDLTSSDDIELWTSTIDFRVHVPVGRVEPFLTYGAGVIGAEGSGAAPGRFDEVDFVVRGGGGVAFQVTNAISVYASAVYNFPVNTAAHFDHTTAMVGVLYKFYSEE